MVQRFENSLDEQRPSYEGALHTGRIMLVIEAARQLTAASVETITHHEEGC